MPWCDDCSRFYNPNTLPETGECPSCGRALIRPARLRRVKQGHGTGADVLASRADREAAPAGPESAGDATDAEGSTIPWHFWVLVVALAVYLGWRLVQLVLWLAS